MAKTDKINELLHRELAEAINQELARPDMLITITEVSCSPDLQSARVGVSILPASLAGTALKKLRSSSGVLSSVISKKSRLRKLPRLNWYFDSTEKEAADLEDLISDISCR